MSETREERRERRNAEADERDRALTERSEIVQAARDVLDAHVGFTADPAVRVALRDLFAKVRVEHDPEEGPITVVIGPSSPEFVALAKAIVVAAERKPGTNHATVR